MAITGATVALGVGLLAAPAEAKGNAVAGPGSQYFLNDSFTGTANTVFTYGDPADDVYVGDWDGNGTDTLMIRRGNTFYVRNTNSSGPADVVFSYGEPRDMVVVGDWDGNGTDTLAVRRGNTFYVKNCVTTGIADAVFSYGDAVDTVLVGDWDGNKTDTLVIRRGGQYFVKNSLSTGIADTTFNYGDPGDSVLVGRWSSAQAGDALGVRRGGTYYLRNSLTSGPADTVFGYGDPTDTAFVGDWNGDGVDTLGVRRLSPPPTPVPPPPPAVQYGDATYQVGSSIPAGIYRSSGGGSCSWERLSGFGGTFEEIIVDGGDSPDIVEIKATDVGFRTAGCGYWQPVAQTYPSVPQTSVGDGGYVVGKHIAPGTYRTSGGSACYWERVSGFGETFAEVIAYDIPMGPSVVTISASDARFRTFGCGTWTP